MDKLSTQIQYLRTIRYKLDETYVRDWLFEYSCQMIEILGYNPIEQHLQILPLMTTKLKELSEVCTDIYKEDEYRNITFELTPMSDIASVVKSEYEIYKEKEKINTSLT